MKLDHTTHAETGMLIRRPVSEVFEAFVNPEITTKFWFTDSTGQLEKGKVVEWTWKMYDFTGFVLVKELIADRSIEIEWGPKGAPPSRAAWTFERLDEHATFVSIVMDGFAGDEEAVFHNLIGSVGGFCWVLAGLKAWLEHEIRLNLVRDRFPKGKG
jgi:uncharacterized protein YndB with AHSA1/START domain